jgi:hypothetical protein
MDLSGVSKTNPTYISAKEQLSNVEKTITSIKENINENAKEIVKGSLAQAENSIKNITKLLNTAQTSQPDDKLLKQAEDIRKTLIEAVSENAKHEIESVTYQQGSYLYNREVERIEQNRDAMIERYSADLDKATFKYLHNIEKIIETLRNATKSAELSKSRIERSDRAGNGGYLGLSSAIGSIGNFTQGDTSISQALSGAITNTNYAQQAKATAEAERIRKKEKNDLTEQLALVVKINKEKKTQLANYKKQLEDSQKLVEKGLLTEEEKTKQLVEQERLKGNINELERIVGEGDTAENALLNQTSTIAYEGKSLEATKAYLTDLENTKQKWTSLGVGVKIGDGQGVQLFKDLTAHGVNDLLAEMDHHHRQNVGKNCRAEVADQHFPHVFPNNGKVYARFRGNGINGVSRIFRSHQGKLVRKQGKGYRCEEQRPAPQYVAAKAQKDALCLFAAHFDVFAFVWIEFRSGISCEILIQRWHLPSANR